ncbi:LysR substrate-binding domain-containing protein [Dongshaea marina]|uniref:LysR substrate-binding domain-containing protein n=1 Tax=Dongshaea marina TaxID=2047966 RepID=UPI00131ED263|nr:LysR substrate-binding domain-containing protein [Dongshaea marina]
MLADINKRWPQLSIYLNYGDENLDPYGDDYDLYVRMATASDSSLIARPLSAVEYWLCASPDYLQQAASIEEPADLAQHKLLEQRFRQGIDCWRFTHIESDRHERLDLSSAWFSTNSAPSLLQVAIDGGGSLPCRASCWYPR